MTDEFRTGKELDEQNRPPIVIDERDLQVIGAHTVDIVERLESLGYRVVIIPSPPERNEGVEGHASIRVGGRDPRREAEVPIESDFMIDLSDAR